MLGDGARQEAPFLPDRQLWRRSRAVEIVEDEAERFLDLAAFADGRLDPDERERVAEYLAADPIAAADVAAAASTARAETLEAAPEEVIARARALVAPNIIPFRPRRYVPTLQDVVGWSGLVAAMVIAGWLGFNLGMDTSLSVAQVGQPGDDSFLQELLDPTNILMRDFSEGAQT